MAAPAEATLAWATEAVADGSSTVVLRARVDGDESSRLIEIERTALETSPVPVSPRRGSSLRTRAAWSRRSQRW